MQMRSCFYNSRIKFFVTRYIIVAIHKPALILFRFIYQSTPQKAYLANKNVQLLLYKYNFLMRFFTLEITTKNKRGKASLYERANLTANQGSKPPKIAFSSGLYTGEEALPLTLHPQQQ